MMPQQTSGMSQQSGMWGIPPQNNNTGFPYLVSQQSNYLKMSQQPNNMNMSQQSGNFMSQSSNRFPMSQQMDSSRNYSGSNNYAMSAQNAQYGLMMQEYGARQQPARNDYNQAAATPQQPRGNAVNNQQGSDPMYSGGTYQGNTDSNFYQGGNFGRYQDNQSTYGSNRAGMNDQLDEFYASIERDRTGDSSRPSQQQFFRGSEVDQQSSTVSSSTHQFDQKSGELQRNMGQNPMFARNQKMNTGMSNFDKGGMPQGFPQPVSQEADSSTSQLQANKDRPSAKFNDDDTDYCKLCNIYFTSPPMYAFHLRGVTHMQRMLSVDAGMIRDPSEKPFIVSGHNYTQTVPLIGKGYSGEKEAEVESEEEEFPDGPFCEVCELHVANESLLWRHISGKKHLKAVNAVQEGRPLPEAVQKRKRMKLEEEKSIIENAFENQPKEEPIVGLGYIIETVAGKGEVFVCELCDTRCNQNNMMAHVTGLKHRLAYLKACDEDRYNKINKKQRKSRQIEEVRQMCIEIEKSVGRGTPKYKGPPRETVPEKRPTPPPLDFSHFRDLNYEMSESEKLIALEALKCTLLDDFQKRNIEPELANKILESRLELLREYERRGVPFVLARERVIEEEERWNLLLEFERQILPFEEAEQRIDHRFELMKMYEKNGLPSDEARRKVLDDEVIYDFKDEFRQLGLRRDQAQKMAEKRLWMLENLHYQGLSPEEASEKVIQIEKELRMSLSLMHKEKRRGRGSSDSQAARWLIIAEEMEMFIINSCKELGLSAEQSEAQLKIAMDALDAYRKRRLSPDEARCRVLVDDLQIPERNVEESHPVEEMDSANDPGSQTDIENRVQQFLSKLKDAFQMSSDSPSENKEADKPEVQPVDRDQQLADYDQQSRLEIRCLLSEMLRMKIPAEEARKRLEALYKQHETLRESLFPPKKTFKKTSALGKPSKSKDSEKTQTSEKAQPSDSPEASQNKLSSVEEQEKEKLTSVRGEGVKDNNGEDQSLDTKNETSSTKKDNFEGETESEPHKGSSCRKPETEHKQSKGKRSLERSRSSRELRGEKDTDKRTVSSADQRWKASVEMFLQQYHLKKDEFGSDLYKRRSDGQDRYSPSDLSPRRQRRTKSKSRDHSRRSARHERFRRSAGRERPRSRSRPDSLSRTGRRRRSGSRSLSPPWRNRFDKFMERPRSRSSLRSRFESEHSKRTHSPGYRSRLRSIERELNYSPEFNRRSPPRRFPYSSERRWSPQRHSRSRHVESPFNRRSRHSPSFSRYPSDGMSSPEIEMNRMITPLDRPRRLEHDDPDRFRSYKPQFSFEGGVWLDDDEEEETFEWDDL